MEQVNPNAMGAPAEGFGQAVSFAFDPRGEVPQQQPITSQPRQVGFSGGMQQRQSNPNTAYAEPADQGDRTGALLMKVGEELLEKKLAEQRTEKFVAGMQRAMNGEAIKDVVSTTPWYAKLFGDTPVIEGARAYTAAAKVNEAVATQTAGMGKIQALTGPEAAKHFSGLVNSSLTGDPGTDNVIMKGMTEQLPALMKAQAKAHYAYGQRQAAQALSHNMTSGASGVQAYGELFADDKVSAADMKVQTDAYVRSILPPEGIDEENYTKALTANMIGMAQKGQFHALEAIKKSDGFLQALTPEQATRIEAATMAQATKARDNYAFTYAREIAEIKSDAAQPNYGGTPRSISDRIDGMNAKYQRLTGSPVGLFSSDQKADMIAGTFNAIKAAHAQAARASEVLASKAATADEKEAAAAQLDANVRSLVASGDFPALATMRGVTPDMVHRTVLDMVRSDPVAGGSLLLNGWIKGEYVNPIIQKQITQPIRLSQGSEVPDDGWFASVKLFNDMKATKGGGLLYAQAYFGEHTKKMQIASSMLGEHVLDHPQSARIFQMSMGGTQERKPVPLSKDDTKKLLVAVADLNSNALVRKFTGATKLRPDSLALIADVAQESTENWRGADMSDQEAVAMGMADAVTTGKLEVIGGFAIKNMDGKVGGKAPTSLKALASTATNNIPSDKADAYFEGFMQDFKHIPTDGDIKIMRRGESGGTHHFTVVRSYDGVASTYSFTAAEWAAYAATRTVKDTAPAAPGRWAFGPAITYGADGKTDIYSHAAAGRKEVVGSFFGGLTNSTQQGANIYSEAARRAREQADIAKRHQLKP